MSGVAGDSGAEGTVSQGVAGGRGRLARTKLATTSILLFVAAATLAAVLPQVAGATSRQTKIVKYVMWTAKGELRRGLHVGARVKGYCWTESMTIPGEYRCMAGNDIYDPCFARPDVKTQMVGCAKNPWMTAIVEMRLTKKLPALPMSRTTGTRAGTSQPEVVVASTLPWALRLSSGLGCVLGTGTNALVDGHLMVYYCSTGVAAKPYTSKEPWTTLYSKSDLRGPLVREAIAVAWI